MVEKKLVRKEEAGVREPWRPFREMRDLRELMSSTIEDLFGARREWPVDFLGGRTWAPAMDVEEGDKEYVFEIAMPGLEKDDFKIELQNATLSVSGERKERHEHKGRNYLRHEQYYGLFRRAFSMPPDAQADGVKAAYKNGILTITVPRSEKQKPKLVPISGE